MGCKSCADQAKVSAISLWRGATGPCFGHAGRQQGVGLLISPRWKQAMFSFYQFGPRLLSTHFKAVIGQHVTMVVAYAPMDMSNASVKDAFHLLMFSCLKVVPRVDKVVVLGDFNVELGYNWESFASTVGRHHFHHGKAPSDNGE